MNRMMIGGVTAAALMAALASPTIAATELFGVGDSNANGIMISKLAGHIAVPFDLKNLKLDGANPVLGGIRVLETVDAFGSFEILDLTKMPAGDAGSMQFADINNQALHDGMITDWTETIFVVRGPLGPDAMKMIRDPGLAETDLDNIKVFDEWLDIHYPADPLLDAKKMLDEDWGGVITISAATRSLIPAIMCTFQDDGMSAGATLDGSTGFDLGADPAHMATAACQANNGALGFGFEATS